jgi:hypothetical protein
MGQAGGRIPAAHALVALRDRLTAELPAAPQLFHDIRVINDKLGDLQHLPPVPATAGSAGAAERPRRPAAIMACGDFELARRCLPHPEQHRWRPCS